jgi:hypothetical protein
LQIADCVTYRASVFEGGYGVLDDLREDVHRHGLVPRPRGAQQHALEGRRPHHLWGEKNVLTVQNGGSISDLFFETFSVDLAAN